MAYLTDILVVERERSTNEQKRQIHLYADGSFYRAYEWSAWLCCLFMRQFKVTKRHIQSANADMVYVGFPQTSLEKFRIEGSKTNEVAEKYLIMNVPDNLINEEQLQKSSTVDKVMEQQMKFAFDK